MIDAKNVLPAGAGGKSLKEQNRWELWLIFAVNSLFLYGVVHANAIRVDGLRAIFSDASNLLPIGFALVIATVLNGVLSAETKARLVFLRWNNALPGHRAFSRYAASDPRIDLAELIKVQGSPLPVNPVDQNRAWYRIYKTVDKEPAVSQVHRDFLLLRDYTGLCAQFVVVYGGVGLYATSSRKVGLLYLAMMIVQYAIVRQAASNYGIRMVTTVLALKAAKSGHTSAKRTPKGKRNAKGSDAVTQKEDGV
jgi:hypothetical protein